MFSKEVCIDNGDYGVVTYSNDGEAVFTPIGRLPKLEEIFVGLENECLSLKLSETKFQQRRVAVLDGKSLYNGRGLDELTAKGFDVKTGAGGIFLDALRLLVDEQEKAGVMPTITFDRLGWYPRVVTNEDGAEEYELLFRANELIGTTEKSRYDGEYNVGPTGDYAKWREMIIQDVLPHIGLQVVLVAALSSVVVGLLGLHRNLLRPIYHLHSQSGTGKTTAVSMAQSCLGSGACSPVPGRNAAGQIVYKQPLVSSWGATSNAITGSQRGNFGAVVVLNELGKCLERDLTTCCYDLSEGTEKIRLTSDLKVRRNEGFCCVFLSTGEVSLYSRCRNTEGLALRILEIDTPLTASADHANRIAEVCQENYGFATPKLADYIIKQGGFKPLNQRFNILCKDLRKHFPQTPSVERFIDTFVAPCLLTIELAKEALGISFDAGRVLQYFVDYENVHGKERATSELSYDELLQEFAMNKHHFIRRDNSKPAKKSLKKKAPAVTYSGTLWGRVTEKRVVHKDGRTIIREYEVFPKIVKQILKQNQHDSVKSCEDAWISMGVLSYDDDDHRTRKRQMFSDSDHKDRMYVFYEFEESDGSNDLDTPSIPEGEQGSSRKGSQIDLLLQDDDDDFDDFSFLEEDESDVA